MTYDPEANRWPAWYYGPDDQAKIFHSADEVPQGWETHPSKVRQPKKAASDDDRTIDSIKAELDAKKINYQANWPREKLLSVLSKAGSR